MPLLEIRDVHCRFGDLLAVDGVSFDVEAGEFFTLVGTSGCGKTTLLRAIAGAVVPDRGEILLNGQSLAGVPPEERPIHTVFQSYALFPHLTVTGNVAFPLQMARHSRREIARRVDEVLALVELSDKAHRFPHELSGGQRQRVALARALADLPQLLLLDEPLAALDPKLREQMQVELIRLQRTLGITFVLVTHSQTEALALSHRIAVMAAGRIEQIDPPSRLYGFPKNRFVAEFIGHCTFVAATVTAVADDYLQLAAEHLGSIRTPRDGPATVGRRGWLALRPEQLQIGHPGVFGHLPHRLLATVRDFLYTGDVTTYIVETSGGLRMEALLANSAPGRARFFETGETVELAWSDTVGRYLDE